MSTMHWYSQYRGRGCGRVPHGLECYCPFYIVEDAQIGEGKVTYHGKPFATYTWENEDTPVFKFLDDPDFIYEIKQRVYKDCMDDYAEFFNNDRVYQYNDILRQLSAAKLIGQTLYEIWRG